MILLGSFSIVIGSFVLLLMLIPDNDAHARKCIAAVAGMIYLVGFPLLFAGIKHRRKDTIDIPEPAPELNLSPNAE